MNRRLKAAIDASPDLAARIERVLLGEAERIVVTEPAALVRVAWPLLAGREAEGLVCVALDRRRRVVDAEVLTTGSDAFTIVDVAQILRWVLTRKRVSRAFALAHNHPSGDPAPSPQDRDVTTRVAAAARVVGLQLLDHIVVTDEPDTWRSMAADGSLPCYATPSVGVTA